MELRSVYTLPGNHLLTEITTHGSNEMLVKIKLSPALLDGMNREPVNQYQLNTLRGRVCRHYKMGYHQSPDLVKKAVVFVAAMVLCSKAFDYTAAGREDEAVHKSSYSFRYGMMASIFFLALYNVTTLGYRRDLGDYNIVRTGVGSLTALFAVVTHPFTKCRTNYQNAQNQ